MSPYINGDRLVYVNADVSPPLPKETVIGGHKCRIWHQSQKNFCKRCASHGHRTSDIGICESYDADSAVLAWRADSNPLSNFFKCRITYGDCEFKSSEHFYQYEFCLFMERSDIAQLVLDATSPREAKQISAQLKTTEHTAHLAEWATIKLSVMSYILKVKWNQCAKFRQALLSTEGMTICEATACDYWGVGVAPNLAQYTKPLRFLGQNHMGKLQMALRLHISQDGVLNDKDQMVLPTKPSFIKVFSSPEIPSSSSSEEDHSCVVADESLSIVSDNAAEVPSSPSCPITSQSEPHPDSCDTSGAAALQSSDTSGGAISQPRVTSDAPNHFSSGTSSAPHNTPPVRPPRKIATVRRKPSQTSIASNLNTLDNYITKDSSAKRKPSGDAASPTSSQVSKSTRTDGADAVS